MTNWNPAVEPNDSFYDAEKKAYERICNINDLRTLQFFARRLRNSTLPFSLVETNDKFTIKTALNDYLGKSYSDIRQREFVSNQLLTEAINNLIPMNQFDWLDENHDACCAVWGILSRLTNRFLHGEKTGNAFIDSSPDEVLYEQMNIAPTPTSHSERLECVKNYFDTWINPVDLGVSKLVFMEKLKNDWRLMLKEVKVFSWLTNPEREGCEWAWRYLEEYDRKEKIDFRPGIEEVHFFYPLNVSEKFLAIYAALRIWHCHKAEKTLLLKNMSKAWQQRQLRREREDKKAINSYVDAKVKEKLDQLARYNRCQINEVLTDLINKEHAQLKSKIDEQFNS